MPAIRSNRGAFCCVQRGLDDAATTKRIAHASFCAPGAKPLDLQTRANWSRKLDVSRAVETATGDWPFAGVLSSPAPTRSRATAWGKPIMHIELLVKATSTGGYATLANQVTQLQGSYPAGLRSQLNAAIGTDSERNPTSTLRAGGFVQDSVAACSLGSVGTDANRGKLQLRAFSTTLAGPLHRTLPAFP